MNWNNFNTKMSTNLQHSHFATAKKDKYSFSKSPRFPALHSNYQNDYFQKPQKKGRATSFGFGHKCIVFDSKEKAPSPFAYHIDDSKEIKKKGVSFGLGRNEIKHGSYIGNLDTYNTVDKKFQHNTDKLDTYKKKQPSCVMIGKHPSDSFAYVPAQVKCKPNPTLYNPMDTTFSRRKKSPACKFPSASRFDYKLGDSKKYVGPGDYDIKKEKIRNVSFDHAVRKTYVTEYAEKIKTPGPIYDVQ